MKTISNAPDTIKAIVGAVVTDGVALGVSFGVNISSAQQFAILAFVGSFTTLAVAVVGWVETHHIRAAASIKAAKASIPSAPPV